MHQLVHQTSNRSFTSKIQNNTQNTSKKNTKYPNAHLKMDSCRFRIDNSLPHFKKNGDFRRIQLDYRRVAQDQLCTKEVFDVPEKDLLKMQRIKFFPGKIVNDKCEPDLEKTMAYYKDFVQFPDDSPVLAAQMSSELNKLLGESKKTDCLKYSITDGERVENGSLYIDRIGSSWNQYSITTVAISLLGGGIIGAAIQKVCSRLCCKKKDQADAEQVPAVTPNKQNDPAPIPIRQIKTPAVTLNEQNDSAIIQIEQAPTSAITPNGQNILSRISSFCHSKLSHSTSYYSILSRNSSSDIVNQE